MCECQQYLRHVSLDTQLLCIQAASWRGGAENLVKGDTDGGHTHVTKLAGSPAQQLCQHGSNESQRAGGHWQHHESLRGGPHWPMQSPWQQQQWCKLLENFNKSIHSLRTEEGYDGLVPLQVFLLACTNKESYQDINVNTIL